MRLSELAVGARFRFLDLEEGTFIVVRQGTNPLVRPAVRNIRTFEAFDATTGETKQVKFKTPSTAFTVTSGALIMEVTEGEA